MQVLKLEHCFTRSIPREVEKGILYVSMEYGTAVHSCCCGCGEQVVTPFSPTDWKMIFDGQSVSLSPSIGNWQLPCRSHYIIREGRIIEAGAWSQAQVNAEQRRDKASKALFYCKQAGSRAEQDPKFEDLGKPLPPPAQTTYGFAKIRCAVVAWFRGYGPRK